MYSKTIVVGRAGRDPEMKYLPSGVAVTETSVAEDRGRGDDKKTIWWRVTWWREAAESVAQHVHKGDVLIVEGQANASAWVADDGEARASLELTAHAWRFGGGGSRDDREAAPQGRGAREESDLPF